MSFDWNHMILHFVDSQHVLVYHVIFSGFCLCHSFTQYQSFQNAQTLGQIPHWNTPLYLLVSSALLPCPLVLGHGISAP